MVRITVVLFLLSPISLFAQETMNVNPPYHQISDAPEVYNINTIIARMIDGLGYRYYWATKDLTTTDLEYSPGNEGRPSKEVLTHIYGLTTVVLNSVIGKPNVRPATKEDLTWEEQRTKTLNQIKEASDILKSKSAPLPQDINITFKRGDKTSEFPLWNLLNGPLADALYHTGQIVSFRRSSGNPVHPGVSVFMGKTKE
ncbi:MAG: hypothetical protein V3V00_12165 [Saprospiraceae bacterium]